MRSPQLLVLAAVVAVLLAVTGWAVWGTGGQQDPNAGPISGPPSQPTSSMPVPTADPDESSASATPLEPDASSRSEGADQAESVDAILQQSLQARRLIASGARGMASHCPTLGNDRDDLDEGLSIRRQMASTLSQTPVDDLPDGEDLAAEFDAFLEASIAADKAYIAASGARCGSGTRSHGVARGDALSGDALQAKEAFLQDWNVLAESFGLPRYSSADI